MFNKKIELNEILEGKHPTFQTSKLKNKLLKSGIKKNQCECCGLTDIWNNKKIIMHLDHINGKSDDHRLENLQILCPNCHSQTETYAGKNKCNFIRLKSLDKKKKRQEKVLIDKLEREVLQNERIDFIKKFPKKRGWVIEISKKLNISHTHVRRLYNKGELYEAKIQNTQDIGSVV